MFTYTSCCEILGTLFASISVSDRDDFPFGFAVWSTGDANPFTNFHAALLAMRQTVAYSTFLLRGDKRLLASTSVAIGSGWLRGAALLKSASGPANAVNSHLMSLGGPGVVETIYGEIPNRCGAIAKGKDVIAAAPLFDPKTGKFSLSLFWQAWTVMPPTFGQTAHKRPPTKHGIVPNDLFEMLPFIPGAIPTNAAKPYLIGFSLDFAQSRIEYANNAHLARTVVDRILERFDKLYPSIPTLFVSPRYGDGVAAVIAIEAKSEAEVLVAPWRGHILDFVMAATRSLSHCKDLGLRIGMAVTLDTEACAPRLAGLGHNSSTAVEPLAQRVIHAARKCHDLAKKTLNSRNPIKARKEAVLLTLLPTGRLRPTYGRQEIEKREP